MAFVFVFSLPRPGVSQSTLDFLLCRATSLDERGEGGKEEGGGGGGGGGGGVEEGSFPPLHPLAVSLFEESLAHIAHVCHARTVRRACGRESTKEEAESRKTNKQKKPTLLPG